MLDPVWFKAVTRRLRHGHEHTKAIAAGHVPVGGSETSAITDAAVTGADDLRRVLALVINNEHGQEEGALFLFKTGANGHLETVATIPVVADLELRINQSSTGEEDALSEQLGSPVEKSDIILSIEGSAQCLSLAITDAKSLHDLLSLTRELKAKLSATSLMTSHHWLRWYNPSLSSSKVPFNASNYHRSPSSLDRPPVLRSPFPPQKLSKATRESPGNEEADYLIMREAHIREKMRERVNEYSTHHPLSLHISTFNVNGKPPSERLFALIGRNPDGTDKTKQLPDIFVFGFQELDLSPEALLYLSTTEKEDSWCDAVLEDLGDAAEDYVKLVSKQLVGMLIFVLVRKSLRPHIHNVSSTASGQGLMWMGNKGGVGIRFRIYDTVFTFVNSHLAAFDEMVERRNADYNELRKYLKFPEPAAVPAQEDAVNTGVHHSGVFESDYAFWFGDQNYRIDLPDGDVRELIREGDLNFMKPFDQLTEQKRLGKAFTEFAEGEIHFPPTYKFELGATLGLVYDAKRRPAWTDRIMFCVPDSSPVNQLSYESHPYVSISDHKPVTSLFEIEARSYKLEEMVEVLEEVLTPLEDTMVSETKPELALDPPHMDFGTVSYRVPAKRSVKLTNSGTVACAFRFVQPTAHDAIAPPWLTVTPTFGIILPGKTVTVEATILVEHAMAAPLNSGRASLKDVLILHVERGDEYYVSLAGQFKKTCLGNSLSWLASLPDAIRKVEGTTVEDKHGGSAPREVMRLVSWLMSNAVQEASLFLAPADEALTAKVIECLDTGDEFPSPGQDPKPLALAIGHSLLLLLESLTEPIVPWKYHSACSTALGRDEAFSVIEDMPPASTNVLISVTAFLHFTLQETDEPRAEALARVFGPVLLKNNPSSPPFQRISPVAKARFILYLIK